MQPFEPLWTFVQRRNCGDQRLYSDSSRCQEFHGLRVFSCRCARSLQADLPRDHLLQRQSDFGGNVPDQYDGSTLANRLDSATHSLVSSHCFNRHVHTDATGKVQYLLHEASVDRQHRCRTDFLSKFEAREVDVRYENAGATGDAQRLCNEQSNHARPENKSRAVGRNLRQRNGVNRNGHGLQHRCFCKRKIVRQPIYDAGRNDNIFGKGPRATIVRARDSHNLAVVAEIYFPAAAGTASAAIDGGIECDSVSFRESFHIGAHCGDSSGGFVSHDNGRDTAPRRTIVAVDVATADATGGNAHENFTGTWRWLRKFGNLKMLVLRKQKDFHARLAPIRSESRKRPIL